MSSKLPNIELLLHTQRVLCVGLDFTHRHGVVNTNVVCAWEYRLLYRINIYESTLTVACTTV